MKPPPPLPGRGDALFSIRLNRVNETCKEESNQPMGNRTALFAIHQEEGGKIVDFAGWDMPLQYSSITNEHKLVREQTGLFDVSHMGRFWFEGQNAGQAIDAMFASNVASLSDGQTKYTVVCNEQGGVKDDVLVTRLSADCYFAVVNASNREKLLEWFQAKLPQSVTFIDRTFESGMIAVQGRDAVPIVDGLIAGVAPSGWSAADMAYYTGQTLSDGIVVTRTGYTGEDGFEVIAPNEPIQDFWRQARQAGAHPAGLGARDSLRLEMGFPLYGHELNEETTPLEAGIKRIVELEGRDFIGKEALAQMQEAGVPRRRIAFQLDAPGVPRQGCALYDGDQPIGEATSGGFSPVLAKGIGLALVNAGHAKPEALQVEIRNKKVPAHRVRLPFVEKRVKA